MIGEQIPLPVQLRDRASFTSFVPGANAAAIDALRSGQADLFLAGAAGSGKSHLLHARLREQGGSYTDAALIATHGEAALAGLGDSRWLAIDDLDALTGADAAIALARLLDQRRRDGLVTVLAGRRVPAERGDLLADLRTRLALCAVFTLQALGDDDLREWLRTRAAARGLELPDAVAEYLIRRLPRDAASLGAAIDRLDRAALVAQRGRLSVPFVQRVLGLG